MKYLDEIKKWFEIGTGLRKQPERTATIAPPFEFWGKITNADTIKCCDRDDDGAIFFREVPKEKI